MEWAVCLWQKFHHTAKTACSLNHSLLVDCPLILSSAYEEGLEDPGKGSSESQGPHQILSERSNQGVETEVDLVRSNEGIVEEEEAEKVIRNIGPINTGKQEERAPSPLRLFLRLSVRTRSCSSVSVTPWKGRLSLPYFVVLFSFFSSVIF